MGGAQPLQASLSKRLSLLLPLQFPPPPSGGASGGEGWPPQEPSERAHREVGPAQGPLGGIKALKTVPFLGLLGGGLPPLKNKTFYLWI